MSIATELTNYKTYLTNAYNKCAEREAVIPANRNMQNITNCIDSINRYTELTYIENVGTTQYIDTGFIPNYTTGFKIEMEFQEEALGYRYCLIANYNNTTNDFSCETTANNEARFYVNKGYLDAKQTGVTSGRNKVIYEYSPNTYKMTINDTLKTGSYTTSGATSGSLYLFVDRQKRFSTFNHALKMFYCKIWSGNTLVRDLIPVLDANNVACMYDKVNNVFYYNQGTGTFTAGDVVLDYIESTGTQYLNTSVASVVNTKVNMKVMFPQISSSDAWFFGINYTNNFLVSLGIKASYPRFQYKSPNYVFSFAPTTSTNTKYQVEAYFGASSQYVKVNGTTRLSKTEALVNGSNQGSFRLFNRLDQGDTNLNMRLYSCKIYKDDVLVADFIPVLKADTKEPCLYDKTRNLYKANLGTGTFLFG